MSIFSAPCFLKKLSMRPLSQLKSRLEIKLLLRKRKTAPQHLATRKKYYAVKYLLLSPKKKSI